MVRALSFALLAALAAASCGGNPPSPASTAAAPSGQSTPAVSAVAAESSPTATGVAASPEPSPAWRDAVITHPDAVNGFASQPPGYYCDPCHNLSEDNLFGVAAVAGGYVAVGAVTPPASAIVLTSADALTWTPAPGFTGGDGSAAVAVAAADGRTVLVGHDPSGATAWAREGGGSWRQAPAQNSLAVAHAAGGMTSVVAFGGGFVGAGYRDDPAHLRSAAAVWRSKDGLTWTLDSDGGTFDGGRIQGLAATGDTLVAVGTAGDPIGGPAAAWRWTRAAGWQRAQVPTGGGAMRAVVATPQGLVAVGVNGGDAGAAVWTSPDGAVWTAVPDQAAFHFYDLPVRLQAVALAGETLVAAGWRSDPGKGSSVAITSRDGRTWTELPWQASFSGGQIDGLAFSGARLVAAGRVGYPDTDTAAVWVRDWP